MFDMARVALNITHWRKRRNMTQLELADQLGVSFQAVSNWERGLAMPDISKLPELAALFGISIDTLLTDGIVTDDESVSAEAVAQEYSIQSDARERGAERGSVQAEDVDFDELAEKYFIVHDAILFPAIVKEISDMKVKELFKRAIEDHDLVPLCALKGECEVRFKSDVFKKILPDIPAAFWDEQLERYVEKNDMPFICFLVSSASTDAKARLKRTALLQGKSTIYAVLD